MFQHAKAMLRQPLPNRPKTLPRGRFDSGVGTLVKIALASELGALFAKCARRCRPENRSVLEGAAECYDAYAHRLGG